MSWNPFKDDKRGWTKDKLPGFEWYDEKYALNMRKNAERIEKKNREYDAKVAAEKARKAQAKKDAEAAKRAKKAAAKKKSGW